MTPPHRPEGHHPGPPRFVHVDEKIVDPIFVDSRHGLDRDNLAPSIDGEPRRDPDPYDPADFSWSLVEAPADSEADVAFAPSPYDDVEQYDHGDHHTAEFEPDVPGAYVFELAAPDGTHHQTVRVLPEAPDDAGGPPRLALDGHYDAPNDEFVLTTDAERSPTSDAFEADLRVEWLPEDDAGLEPDDVIVEDGSRTTGDALLAGRRLRVPADALDGVTRLFAAPYGGQVLGNVD
ncbi:MAG: hypothetical protein ABEI57_01910 [Halapricum sp.]